MLVRFTKGREQGATLTCLRPDGSQTWKRLHPQLVHHDLIHLVVETHLGRRESLFGTLAKGHSIKDYGRPGADAMVTPEAAVTEHLVALLQLEFSGQDPDPDLPATLRQICAGADLDGPEDVTIDACDRLRRRIAELLRQWSEVDPGGTLERRFASEAPKLPPR